MSEKELKSSKIKSDFFLIFIFVCLFFILFHAYAKNEQRVEENRRFDTHSGHNDTLLGPESFVIGTKQGRVVLEIKNNGEIWEDGVKICQLKEESIKKMFEVVKGE